jgi:hypothetical protein
VPGGVKIEEGFVMLQCYKPESRKSWSENFRVVDNIEDSSTDEYDAILGATAPARFRDSLSSDEDAPTSYPIGFANLGQGTEQPSELLLLSCNTCTDELVSRRARAAG